MQATEQIQTPTAPAAASVASPSVSTTGPDGTTQTLPIPRTETDIEALKANREELSNQLSSVTDRRHALSEEIRSAPEGASRTGLETRLNLLDKRIIQLESDIAATGRQLSAAPAELIASTESPAAPNDDYFAQGMAAGVFGVLVFYAVVALYRRFKRRGGSAPSQANLPSDSAQRLERLEHGMDATALEIERVGEGQRFVTRLLSETHARVAAPDRIAERSGAEPSATGS